MKPSHPKHEIPLVAFTLLVQLCLGAFLGLGILHTWIAVRVGAKLAYQLTLPGFLALIPLIALALLISLLHLGKPAQAWRAVTHLRSSWLSREVLLTLLFGIFLTTFGLHFWQQTGNNWLGALLWLLASVAGVLGLLSMVRIYQLRTIPIWNNWMTAASFLISTVLLGCLFVGSTLTLNPLARGNLQRLPWVVISLITLGLLTFRLLIVVSRRLRTAERWWSLLQVSLLAFGLIFTSLLVYQSVLSIYSERNTAISVLGCITFLIALAGEVVARWTFYRNVNNFVPGYCQI